MSAHGKEYYRGKYNARHKELMSAWREKNKEKSRAYSKEWREREENAERLKQLAKAWSAANRHKQRAKVARFRWKKTGAAPPWLTPEQYAQIEAFYLEASRRQDATGIPHHVDHIVPLRAKGVCGLHVPWNLQVLSGKENQSKGARYE